MAKKRRKRARRIRLGASEAEHVRNARSFALEALRVVDRVKSAPDCRTAYERLGKVQKLAGALTANSWAMENGTPKSILDAAAKIDLEIQDASRMLAARCLR